MRKIVVNLSRVTKDVDTILLYDTFWCQVMYILGNAPILPHLTAIHFFSMDCYYPIDMGVLRLLNPSIQELTIEVRSVDPTTASRLEAAFESCFSSTSNLQRLSLISNSSPLDLEALPQSHPHLRYLKVVQPVSPTWLTSIASLPDLEFLSICILESINIPVQFKKLRSLSITRLGPDGDNAAITIASTEAPHLRKFSFDSSHVDSTTLRTELLQWLEPLVLRFPSLIAFEWKCWQFHEFQWGYHGSRYPGATLAELIEPLLSLRTLRDLLLDVDGPFVPYSFTDFRRMAEAWPDLETLSLKLDHAHNTDSARSNDPTQYANIDSLVSLARRCPCLHTLRIPRVLIDSITHIPSLTSPSESEYLAAGHRLLHLHVSDDILCFEAPRGKDGPRRNEVFREMMMPVFPFAAFHLPVFITDIPTS